MLNVHRINIPFNELTRAHNNVDVDKMYFTSQALSQRVMVKSERAHPHTKWATDKNNNNSTKVAAAIAKQYSYQPSIRSYATAQAGRQAGRRNHSPNIIFI